VHGISRDAPGGSGTRLNRRSRPRSGRGRARSSDRAGSVRRRSKPPRPAADDSPSPIPCSSSRR
jgi:hypothetical protein